MTVPKFDMEPRPSAPSKRRRRAVIACTRCHQRKVRCDLARCGSPCTNCRLDCASCTDFNSGKRRGKKRAAGVPEQIKFASAPDAKPLPISIKIEDGDVSPAMNQDGARAMPEVYFNAYSFLELKDLAIIPQSQVQELGRRGSFFVPTRPVLGEFLRKYFLYVHPALPLLNEADVWSMYHAKQQNASHRRSMSLFVLQCVLFSSSGYFTTDRVREWGFPQARDMRQFFYERATYLFDSGAERDRLSQAQGAVLLSHYFCTATPFTGSMWLNVAVQSGISIRQTSDQNYGAPDSFTDKNLKRLWWCIYLRDRILPLGLRRPILVTPSSYDSVLKCDIMGVLDEEVDKTSVYDAPTKRVLMQLFQLQMKLADSLTTVLSLIYPSYPCNLFQSSCGFLQIISARIQQAKLALGEWKQHASEVFRATELLDKAHPSVTLFSKMTHLYYLAARIALCHYEAAVAERLFRIFKESQNSGARRLRDLQKDVCEASDEIRAILDHLSEVALLSNVPLSALPCIAIPLLLITLDQRAASAGRQSSKFGLDKCFEKVLDTCSCRFGGADDMIQFITSALESAWHLTSEEATHRERADILVLDEVPELKNRLSKPRWPRHWGDLFVEEPLLYMRVLDALDQAFATGTSPEKLGWRQEDSNKEKACSSGHSQKTTEPPAEDKQKGFNEPISTSDAHPAAQENSSDEEREDDCPLPLTDIISQNLRRDPSSLISDAIGSSVIPEVLEQEELALFSLQEWTDELTSDTEHTCQETEIVGKPALDSESTGNTAMADLPWDNTFWATSMFDDIYQISIA